MPDCQLYHEIEKCKIAQNSHKTCNNYDDIEQGGKRAIEEKKALLVLNVHFF